jgi:hypothetical protein
MAMTISRAIAPYLRGMQAFLIVPSKLFLPWELSPGNYPEPFRVESA